MPPHQLRTADVPASHAPPSGRPRRLKLIAVDRGRPDEFRCVAEVTLEKPGGGLSTGRAELPMNEQNYLRVVSRATLAALDEAGAGALELRLVGLRVLRIFDTPVVAVQVAAHGGEREQLLLGVAVANEDGALGAARAVLHATNRLLGNVVER